MTLLHKSPAGIGVPEPPPRWEARSTSRVLETSRDQILERSRQIVQAGYDLLDEVGLDGLTIRAVLKKTGLSRRAFYERFAGKDDLVLAVFEHTIRLAVSFYIVQLATLPEPMARLKYIVTSLVTGRGPSHEAATPAINRRGASMSREHMRLAESRPDDLQAALSPLITLMAELLADGMAAGVVRQHAPQRLAALMYNLVATTVHTEWLAQERAQTDWARRQELAEDIWEFCRRAIAA